MKKSILFFSLTALLSFSALSAKEATAAKPADKAQEATVAKASKKSSEAPAAKPAPKASESAAAKATDTAPVAPATKAEDKAPAVSATKAENKAPEAPAAKAAEASTVKAEDKTSEASIDKATETSSAKAETKAPEAPVASQAPEATVADIASVDINQISEAFGHVIGKNLETIGVKFDVAKVIKGLEDALAGKESPMSELDCIQAIASAQEQVFKQQCAENLKRAESFLSDNAKTAGVVALEEGKVQYKITEQGKGAPVESHFSPLIKYSGKYLDGSVFGSSKEEETISLDEVIPGLKAGLLGMKEGEKRTVYIHPDLAYGTNGYLPPNSLLTFELEIVKANAPIVKETAETDASVVPTQPEIAEVKTDIR